MMQCTLLLCRICPRSLRCFGFAAGLRYALQHVQATAAQQLLELCKRTLDGALKTADKRVQPIGVLVWKQPERHACDVQGTEPNSTVISPRPALGVDQLCSCQDKCTWQSPWPPELACTGLNMSATSLTESKNPAEACHFELQRPWPMGIPACAGAHLLSPSRLHGKCQEGQENATHL